MGHIFLSYKQLIHCATCFLFYFYFSYRWSFSISYISVKASIYYLSERPLFSPLCLLSLQFKVCLTGSFYLLVVWMSLYCPENLKEVLWFVTLFSLNIFNFSFISKFWSFNHDMSYCWLFWIQKYKDSLSFRDIYVSPFLRYW